MTSSVPQGNQVVTATYNGDANFAASTSPGIVVFIDTPNGRFLRHVYADLLNRAPDPGGLNSFLAALNAGVSRTQVVAAIEASEEYRVDEIDNAFIQLLGRPADPNGTANFLTYLNAGGTLEGVDAAIMGSPEYFQNRASNNNNIWLSAVYQDVLHRAIDAAGAKAFGVLLNQEFTPRSTVASLILGSQEAMIDRVEGYYTEFLRRPADPFGLGEYVNLMAHGATDEQVIAMIMGSQEYFQLP